MERSELRALAEAATPGPWEFYTDAMRRHYVIAQGGARAVAQAVTGLGNPGGDAAYIAAADPATVVALLDENDRLRAALDRCPQCDHPLMHDDAKPELLWWCEGCGNITTRPSALKGLA